MVRWGVDRRLIGRFKATAQFSGSVSYWLIEGPECQLLENCRGEEMDIDPSQALPKEFMGFNKRQKLLILNCGRGRQYGQGLEDVRSMFQVAAG